MSKGTDRDHPQSQIPPQAIWLTGLPAAGKTTIANALHRDLRQHGCPSWVLDGDQLRTGLNSDLSFVPADRAENARRVAHVARILVDAGLVAIVALVSPFRRDRAAARNLFAPSKFMEVWVDTPLEVCQRRDPKGLYAKSAAGELAMVTGVGQPYEPPETPNLVLKGAESASLNISHLMGAILDGITPDQ